MPALHNRLERSGKLTGRLHSGTSYYRQHSIKLYGSTGIYSCSGSDFDIAGIAWQYCWGGGF